MARNANTARSDMPAPRPSLVVPPLVRGPEGSIFRAMILSVPVAVALWAVLIWGAIHLMRSFAR